MVEKAIETPCRHWWLVEEHRSRYSPGRCKLCGESRLFDNYPDSYDLHGKGAAYRKMADNNFRASGRLAARARKAPGLTVADGAGYGGR